MGKLLADKIGNLKVLLGNDDGLQAIGLTYLEEIARPFASHIQVFAPDANRSASGHSLTLQKPLRVTKQDEDHCAISGSPTDSLAYGFRYLYQTEEDYPDLVLSGVNNDSNVSDEITYSGTLAVACEATLFGVPAIALSQERGKDRQLNWECSRHFAGKILDKILRTYEFPPKIFLNINFPSRRIEDVRGIRVVSRGERINLDRMVRCLDPRNREYFWIGDGAWDVTEDFNNLDKDVGALQAGYITIQPITVDLTAYSILDSLKEEYNEDF